MRIGASAPVARIRFEELRCWARRNEHAEVLVVDRIVEAGLKWTAVGLVFGTFVYGTALNVVSLVRWIV